VCIDLRVIYPTARLRGASVWLNTMSPAAYQWFTRFSQCDDGGIAEGYSDAIGKLLADKWNQFPDLVKLAGKDKSFQSFVLRHLDETLPDDMLKKVAQNAKSQCPRDAAGLCKLIIRTAAE